MSTDLKLQYDLLTVLDLLVDSVLSPRNNSSNFKFDELVRRNRLRCADDFSVSVQMGRFNYCTPRVSGIPAARYTSVELGYPSEVDELIIEYADWSEQDPTRSVYSLVPMKVVKDLFIAHGGLHPAEVIRLKKIEKQLALMPNYIKGKRI